MIITEIINRTYSNETDEELYLLDKYASVDKDYFKSYDYDVNIERTTKSVIINAVRTLIVR